MTYEGYNKGYKGVPLRKKIRKSFLSDKPLNADLSRSLFKWERGGEWPKDR